MNQEQKSKLIQKKDAFHSIWLRLKAPMPSFWKKMFAAMASLTGLGVSLIGIPAAMTGLGLEVTPPHWLYSMSYFCMTAGAAGAFFSKISVDWNKLSEEEQGQQKQP